MDGLETSVGALATRVSALTATVVALSISVAEILEYHSQYFNGYVGRLTVGQQSTSCSSLEPSFPTQGETVFCELVADINPAVLSLVAACPQGYTVMAQTQCSAVVIGGGGAPASMLPLVMTGTQSDAGWCEASLAGLAEGTVVQVTQLFACSGYIGSDAAKKGLAAAGLVAAPKASLDKRG